MTERRMTVSAGRDGTWHAECFEGATGGDCIQAAIDMAETKPGHNLIVVGPVGPDDDGRWLLTKPIKLPSHTTLLLQGSQLFLADDSNCDMIRNRDYIEGNTDIHVVGVGGARLDGNAAHQTRPVDGRDVEIWMEQNGMKVSVATLRASL